MTWQNPRSAISSACVAWIGYLTTLAVNICRSSCRVTVPRHKASKSMSKPTFAEAVHDAATKLKLPISLWLALLQVDTLCHHRQRELGSKRQAREEEPNKHILAVTQKRVKKDPVAVAPAHIRECCWSWKSTLYRTEKICKICPGQRFAYRYPQEEEDTGIAIEPQ